MKRWTQYIASKNLILFYKENLADATVAIPKVSTFMWRTLNEKGIGVIMKRCDRNYVPDSSKFWPNALSNQSATEKSRN